MPLAMKEAGLVSGITLLILLTLLVGKLMFYLYNSIINY